MTPLEKKQEIMSALAKYRRWLADGKKPYGHGKDEQLYYDGYHAGITQLDDPSYFAFSIQLYDSPQGDTWWSGEFHALNGGTDVEITVERSYRN